MWIVVEGGTSTVMVASTPMPVSQQLAQMREQVSALPEDKQATANTLLAQADAALQKTNAEASEAIQSEESEAGGDVNTEEQSLADVMKQLFEVFGLGDGPLLEQSLTMNTHEHT